MAWLYVAKPFDQLTVSGWDRQLDVDLRASFLFAHAAAPAMRRNGGGRIIIFTDWLAAAGGRGIRAF